MQGKGRLIDLFRQYPSLLMLSVGTGITSLGQGVTGPILPLYAKSFGVNAAEVGLTITAFGIARLVVNIPAGLVSDRIGRRKVLMAGSIILGLASVACGLTHVFWQLLIWRFVAGAGSAMFATTAYSFLSDIGRPEDRARMMGLNQGSLSIGQSAGPALGGFVAEVAGLSAPFFVVGALALCCVLWSYTSLPESNPAPRAAKAAGSRRQASGWAVNKSVLLSLPFFLLSMVTFTTFFTRGAGRQTILPLLASDRFDMTAGSISILFTLMALINLATLPLSGTMADRFGRKATIIPACIVTSVSLIFMGLAGTIWFLVFASMLHGLGSGVSGPAPAAYAADISPEGGRGFAMGLYRTYADAGIVVGPPLAGLVADATSFSNALYLNAAVVAVAAIAFALGAPETVRRQREAPAEPTTPSSLPAPAAGPPEAGR